MADLNNVNSRIWQYTDFNNVIHPLTASYLIDDEGVERDWNDIKAISALQVIDWSDHPSLPTPSADTENKIYLFPSSDNPNIKEMWLTVDDDGNPPQYSWVSLGTTSVDLSDYSQKTHTHTVTPNSIKLSISNTTVGLTTNNTTVVSSLDMNNATRQNVYGEGSTWTPNIVLSSGNLKATASGTALSTNSDNAVISVTADNNIKVLTNTTTFTTTVTPSTSNITVSSTNASFINSVSKTTNKLVTTTVKGVAGTASVINAVTLSANNYILDAVVDANNSLTFTFGTPTISTNTTTVATANSSDTTVATGSITNSGTGSAVVVDVSATTNNALTGASLASGGTTQVVTGITSASTSASGSANVVKSITVNNSAKFLNSASISAQPSIALSWASTSESGTAQVTNGLSSATINTNAVWMNPIIDVSPNTVQVINAVSANSHTHTLNANTTTGDVTVAAATQVTTSQASA